MAVDFVQPTEVAPVEERPVFAARSPHRPRALRIGGRAAAVLTALWVVALGIGAFGFGYLPGLQLPSSHKSSPKPIAPATAGARVGAGGPAASDAFGDIARTARSREFARHNAGSPALLHSHAVSHRTPSGSAVARGHGSNGASATGATKQSTAGSRSNALTSPGRAHSRGTPTPGTGSGGTSTTTEGTTQTTQTGASHKTTR
jgi:hypothetical protein